MLEAAKPDGADCGRGRQMIVPTITEAITSLPTARDFNGSTLAEVETESNKTQLTLSIYLLENSPGFPI